MDKINKRKIASIALALYMFSFGNICSNAERKDIKEYPYSNGIIYIGEDSECDFEIGENDFYVYDRRNFSNPYLKLWDSYRVRDSQTKREIIDILLQYEEDYPSRWHRTSFSMLKEWEAHNILYALGIEEERTGSVDFDNGDEDVFTMLKKYK